MRARAEYHPPSLADYRRIVEDLTARYGYEHCALLWLIVGMMEGDGEA